MSRVITAEEKAQIVTQMHELAKVEGMTCNAAAKKLGVHSATVKRWARANGITALMPRGEATYANRWEEWTATVLRPAQMRQMREYLAAGGLEG